MILLVLLADEGAQKDLFLKQGYIPFYLPGAEEGGVHHFDLSKKEDRERIDIRGKGQTPASSLGQGKKMDTGGRRKRTEVGGNGGACFFMPSGKNSKNKIRRRFPV